MFSFSGEPDWQRRIFLQTVIGCLALAATTVAGQGQRFAEGKDKKSEASNAVYEPGGDVKPPKLVHYVEPDFSPKSKEAYVEGTVKISTIVTTEGMPTECHVVHGLNAEEDRTAMEALKQWKFQPGTKAGVPVRVRVRVEIDFHLL